MLRKDGFRDRRLGNSAWTAWPLQMGQIGCPETSETTNLLYVTPSKSEHHFATTVEAFDYSVLRISLRKGSNYSGERTEQSTYLLYGKSFCGFKIPCNYPDNYSIILMAEQPPPL